MAKGMSASEGLAAVTGPAWQVTEREEDRAHRHLSVADRDGAAAGIE